MHGCDEFGWQGQLFSEVVRRYYEWSDEVFAEVLGWFEPTRQVAVLSDHGFYGPRSSGDKGAAEHSEWGIFLVRSPLYQAGQKFGQIELLDICPTFLALMGLPPAADMPGTILAEGLTDSGRKRAERMEKNRVPSYLALRPAEGPAGEQDAAVTVNEVSPDWGGFNTLRFQIYSDLKDPVILSMHIDDKRSDPPPGDRYDTQLVVLRDGYEVKVKVRYPEAKRRSLGNVEDMYIRTPQGTEVPFYSVAQFELGRGYSTIQRVDGRRVINVIADVDRSLVQTYFP